MNMNINQRMYDNAFSGINNKPQRLGVVLLVGEWNGRLLDQLIDSKGGGYGHTMPGLYLRLGKGGGGGGK